MASGLWTAVEPRQAARKAWPARLSLIKSPRLTGWRAVEIPVVFVKLPLKLYQGRWGQIGLITEAYTVFYMASYPYSQPDMWYGSSDVK